MHGYVGLERSNLKELIHKNEQEEEWLPVNDHSKTRYESSDNLFLYIRSSMNRSSSLTKGKILYDIFKEYKVVHIIIIKS